MKPLKITTILGISLGTRSIGIAVLQDKTLVEWKMIHFLESWSDRKYKRIILRLLKLILAYAPTAIALRLPDSTTKCPVRSKRLVEAVKGLAKANHIKLIAYPFSDLQKHYVKDVQLSKRQLLAYTTKYKPELTPEYYKEEKAKRAYYAKLFEATTVAIMCDKKLDTKER